MEGILLVQIVLAVAVVGFLLYLKTPYGKNWMDGK
jgi:hypothetical protein